MRALVACSLVALARAAAPREPAAVRRVFILGERNSGTTMLAKQLIFALADGYSNANVGRRMYAINPFFGHKHMFKVRPRGAGAAAERAALDEFDGAGAAALRGACSPAGANLWLLLVRRPCDWAYAMYRKPYHRGAHARARAPCGARGAVPGLPPRGEGEPTFERFLSAPWVDCPPGLRGLARAPNASAAAAAGADGGGGLGAPPPARYASVAALRAAKLRFMARLRETPGCRTVVVRMHELEADPEAFVLELAREVGRPVPARARARSRFARGSHLTRDRAARAAAARPQHRLRLRPSPRIVTGFPHREECLPAPRAAGGAFGADYPWELERSFGLAPCDACPPGVAPGDRNAPTNRTARARHR